MQTSNLFWIPNRNSLQQELPSTSQMDDSSASRFLGNQSELFLQSLSTPNLGSNPARINSNIAIRLYQSVRRSIPSPSHDVSYPSETNSEADLNAPTCRICRYVSETNQLIPSPCKCTGTMGFIHLKCLTRWIRMRRTNLCEICKQEYTMPNLERKYFALLLALFRPKYMGVILRDVSNIMSVTPLVYFTVNQLVETMEASSEKPTVKLLFIGPSLLLATSVYFFLYFDWALECMFRMKNVISHWWSFGDQDDDEINDFEPDYDFENHDFFDLEF